MWLEILSASFLKHLKFIIWENFFFFFRVIVDLMWYVCIYMKMSRQLLNNPYKKLEYWYCLSYCLTVRLCDDNFVEHLIDYLFNIFLVTILPSVQRLQMQNKPSCKFWHICTFMYHWCALILSNKPENKQIKSAVSEQLTVFSMLWSAPACTSNLRISKLPNHAAKWTAVSPCCRNTGWAPYWS